MADANEPVTARSIIERLGSRTLSAVDLIQGVLTRIERVDPHVHAFCQLFADEAVHEARMLDMRLAAGGVGGALAGIPVGVKDALAVRGHPTTSGFAPFANLVTTDDDICVERLRAADAIIIGKTNMSELGYSGRSGNSLFPVTVNPRNPAKSPGGSSAGSAAAVAGGLVPIGIGTDAAGSVRVPAALCGVVGFKPSMGRIPLYPAHRDERWPGWSSFESLNHVGVIATTVDDAALVFHQLAGPDPRDRHSIPKADLADLDIANAAIGGLRVGASLDWGYEPVDTAVSDAFYNALKLLDSLGCHIQEVAPNWDDPLNLLLPLVALESDLAGMRELADVHAELVSPELTSFLEIHWTDEALTRALRGRKSVVNALWRLMTQLDVLVTPTTPTSAPDIDSIGPPIVRDVPARASQRLVFTFPFNLSGQPAITVPMPADCEMPLGLQIVGGHLDDRTVLRVARAYEEATR